MSDEGDEGSYILRDRLRHRIELSSRNAADVCYNAHNLRQNQKRFGLPLKPAISMPGTGRGPYEWVPDHCDLVRFNKATGCSLLKERSVLFVGDSVTFQLFLSFALLLNASFPARAYGHRSEFVVAATACDGLLHLNWHRNDMLMSHVEASRLLGRKIRYGELAYAPFMRKAVESDIVVLGGGHHFDGADGTPLYSLANDTRSWKELCIHSALSKLIVLRAMRGLMPASVVLTSTTRAIVRCTQFDKPISPSSLGSTVIAERNTSTTNRVEDASEWRYARQWAVWAASVPTIRKIARINNVSFLDIDAIAATRPDMHLGHYKRWEGYPSALLAAADADCVHYCLPGVPDTWSRLLFNLLIHSLPPNMSRAPHPSPIGLKMYKHDF